MDLATRAHNHNYHMDPIVRSLFDTDKYKFLMLQFIWDNPEYRDYPVTFSLINRNSSLKLADIINEQELRDQLDHARTLRFSNSELIWLQGNTFFGKQGIYKPEFIEWLRGYQLPPYYLEKTSDGQYILSFSGGWASVMMWEIFAMTIINELKTRAGLKKLSKMDLKIMYARATTKLYEKLKELDTLDLLNFTDFGTRRRHSYLWQEECVTMALEVLGPKKFTGTSNVHLAAKLGIDAKGTNAHETQMALATMAKNDEELLKMPYRFCDEWKAFYGQPLSMVLPDTFGTTAFLRHAPDHIADSAGWRFDSKPNIIAGEEVIAWLYQKDRNPVEKIGLWSDGLTVPSIKQVYNHFIGRIDVRFGYGSDFTNDFKGCAPVDMIELMQASIVCKIEGAGERSAVKLSDNLNKATGSPAERERYYRVFGKAGMIGQEVVR